MKVIIQKSKKDNKYVLQDFYIKINQSLNLVIINFILIKKLELKVRSTSILTNHYFFRPIINKDFKELKK